MEKWKEWDRNQQKKKNGNKIYDGSKSRAVRVENAR